MLKKPITYNYILQKLFFAAFVVFCGTTFAEDQSAESALTSAAERSSSDGIFANLFSSKDFKVVGGATRFLPSKKAVIVRDYATIWLKGRRIRARNLVFFTETGKIYAEGDVAVEDKSGTYLNCDRMYFDTRDWKGRANNIRLRVTDEGINKTESVEEKDVRLGELTYEGNTEMVSSAEGGMDSDNPRLRMNVAAGETRMVSRNHFVATDVVASPSNYAVPHWSINSKAVSIRRDEKVEAYHNVFKVGKVPVFYFPYLVYDLKYNWPYYRTAGGYSDRQGAYWLNRVGWEFSNPETDEDGNPIKRPFKFNDMYVDFDTRLDRGYGVGGEAGYVVDFLGKGWGSVKGYWTNEIYTTQAEDERRADEDVEFRANDWLDHKGFERALYANKDRYMLEWEHYQQLTDELSLRGQTHWFSDRDFYKEYFYSDWAEDQEKLTNATLRYLNDHFVSEMVAQGRINDFRSQSEYLPEWRFNLPGLQVADLPLYVDSDTRAGLIRRRIDKMRNQMDLITEKDRTSRDGDTPWLGRVHNETTLSVPIDLKYLTVRPWAGGRLEGYSNGYNGYYEKTDAKFNAAGMWGVDFSTRYYGLLDNDHYRHTIEPTIKVYGLEQPLVSRDNLYYVDDIDNYRESHMTAVSLFQQLETRTAGGGTRKLATLDLGTGFIMDSEEASLYNNKKLMTDISLDAALYPVDALSLWGNMQYSLSGNNLTSAEIGADYWFNKRLRLFLNHSYDSGYESENIYGTTDVGNASNLTTAALRTQLWNKHSHYSLEYAIGYEWNDDADSFIASDGYRRGGVTHGLQTQRITLIRDLDTIELGVSWIVDHANNSNSTFAVNLTPKGWMGVKRSPDTSYIKLDEDYGRYAHPTPEKMQKEDVAYDTSVPTWKK